MISLACTREEMLTQRDSLPETDCHAKQHGFPLNASSGNHEARCKGSQHSVNERAAWLGSRAALPRKS